MSLFNKSDKKVMVSLETSLDVCKYLLEGHTVTVCKPQKVKVSRKVSAKSKLVFGTAEPKNRPSNAWDVLQTS
jgi:hypothetical protein